MEGIKDAITKLAYAKGFYNRDPTAAASAIHDVIGKYEFMGDARIPTANSGTVKPAIRRVLGSMDETNIQVPAQAGQPGMPSAREYVESIKAAPHWITSPDGKGLMLQDNYQRFVRDKSGRPVSIPFDGPTVPLSRNAPPQAAPAAPPVAKQRRSLEDIFGGR
jgi:hypothetical protein